MHTRHAVLYYPDRPFPNTAIMWNEGTTVRTKELPEPCYTLHDVYEVAIKHDVTHVWIHPNYGDFLAESDHEPYSVFATYEDEEKTRLMFARVRKQGTYGEVKIGWPDRGRWGWEIDTPVTILATIHYLEQVLGIPVEWSAGHMGTDLVKLLNRNAKRQEWTRESEIDLSELPFNHAARDILWKTSDLSDMLPGMYLHQDDKRSAYLSACPGVYVGAGTPVHVDGECDTSLPGIYRVGNVSKAESIYDDVVLPPIITTEWVTDDVLNYAIQQGYQGTVIEAWQWTEKHKTLESYATKLWSARRVFREDTARFKHVLARENAENTMKEIALISTGKFAFKKATRFVRPDWWAKVVGKTRVNILRNLQKFYQQGFTPVLIYSDSLYFVSNDPNPRTAIPGMLDRENELGGYKHEGTWLITPELIESFRLEKPGAIQKRLEHFPKVNEVLV